MGQLNDNNNLILIVVYNVPNIYFDRLIELKICNRHVSRSTQYFIPLLEEI